MKTPLARALALVLVLGGSAGAEPTRPVALLAASCPAEPIDRIAFVDALRVELGPTRLFVAAGDVSTAPLLLALETDPCAPETSVIRIVATDPTTGRMVERSVSIRDLPASTRARTVALATAEAIAEISDSPAAADASAPLSLAVAPMPVPPPEVAPTRTSMPIAEAAATREPRGERSWLLGVTVGYRTYTADSTPLLGGRLLSAWHLSGSGLELRGDVAISTGSVDATLGAVETRAFTGAVGVTRVIDAGPLAVTLGPMLEAGYVRVEGRPRSGASGGSNGAPLAALLLDFGVRVHWASLFAVAEMGGGVEMAGVRAHADDDVVVAAAGALVEVRAGIGLSARRGRRR